MKVEGLEDQGGILSCPDSLSMDLIVHYAQKCSRKEEDWTDWVSSGGVHSLSPSLNVAPPQKVHANVQDGDKELIRFVSSRWLVRGILEIKRTKDSRAASASASALTDYHWVLAETSGDLVKKQKMSTQ